MMKEIDAARFNEQCLALLDQLGDEGLIVTKHGKPIAGSSHTIAMMPT